MVLPFFVPLRFFSNAGIARNPVDSFFVVRCFLHTLGTFFIPMGLRIIAQGSPASKRDYPGGRASQSTPYPERVS